MHPIELLSPARNLECGIEAIRHGADAVYIGASRFGARVAAGNSIEDITRLVEYAHPFGVRIYVTVNTLLHDDEISDVDILIGQLQEAHVDALIVQDPRLRAINRGRLPLHASTQMDNRTVDDVRKRLYDGYEQTVLARELSLVDIRAIHEAVPQMALEAFVHGALCVSYSGRCYASEYCFGRSANRGECAQFCRLPFDLIDADGHIVEASLTPGQHPQAIRQRHLLSLKDMNRSADLEAMMDAGISSFKIEGRLKDVGYVKNITSFYRQRLDAILSRRTSDYCRASYGSSTISFKPDPLKSFNRGFTDYFLHGRTQRPIYQPLTPKSLGEPVGSVKDIFPTALAVAGTASFANGDGLCFFSPDGHLQGFRVNRIDDHGRLYPADPSVLRQLHRGQSLFRNEDAAFGHLLSRPTAERRIPIRWMLAETPDGFSLTLQPQAGQLQQHTVHFTYPHEIARTPQADNIRRQLLRLGDTPYICSDADISLQFSDNWFIPSSVLGEWRRQVCATIPQYGAKGPVISRETGRSSAHTITGETSEEQMEAATNPPLMTCRHCIRYALGYCTRDHVALPYREPLSLRLSDGRTFPLHFDCARCEMQVLRGNEKGKTN